jgi:hypothetical protein
MTPDKNRRYVLEKVAEWFDIDGFSEIAVDIRSVVDDGKEDAVRRLAEVLMSAGTHMQLVRIIQ